MANVNKVIIMGRLGKDPELRYTQNHTPVCSITVATTDYRSGGSDGEKQTEWHKVVVWSKAAENVNKYLSKGSGVYIEGRLRTNSWEDQQGQKRYSTEIVANHVQFLPRAGAQSHSSPPQAHAPGAQVDHGGGFPAAYPDAPAQGSPNAPMEGTPLPVIEEGEGAPVSEPQASEDSSQGFGTLPF